jgi:hypothetical protein
VGHCDVTGMVRSTTRWMGRFPLVAWTIIVTAIALSTGALASTSCVTQRSVSHWLTPTQAIQEYRAEARRLQLPPGLQWPKSALGAPEAAGYEEGFAAGRADLYWFIAWSRVAVSPRSSAAARRTALKQLSHVYETPFFRKNLTGKARFREMVVHAQQGDVSELRGFVAVNTLGGSK